MIKVSDFVLDREYQVSLFSPIGGVTTFTGVVVGNAKWMMLPVTANAQTNHINIYPQIPADIKAEIQDDYKSYDYVVLRSDDGSIHYLGAAWINPDSVSNIVDTKATIVLNKFAADQKAELEKILRLNGFTVESFNVA